MAIIHDNVGRRRFLSQTVMGFGLLFGLGTLGLRFVQFLMPSTNRKPFETVLVGTDAQVPPGEAVPMDLAGHKVVLLRTGEGVVAFSRRCTDLGCLVSWKKDREQFVCPCHQGVFDKNGRNIAGPPPRPLDRYEVIKRGEQLYVKLQNGSVG
jgi:cytochrome b6-f complex iron-sulfur subunit